LYRIENLGKSFGNKKVLQNINLKIFKRGNIYFHGAERSWENHTAAAIEFAGDAHDRQTYF